MPDGVKETLCTRCEHREVCIHKLDYLIRHALIQQIYAI